MIVYILMVLDDGFKGWEVSGVFLKAKAARDAGRENGGEFYVSKRKVK
jgi:hypothetical protein